MTDLLKKIEELEYVKNIEFPDKNKFGFNVKIFLGYENITNFAGILLERNFQLNLIKALNDDEFKLIYIFTSLNQNCKILCEVLYENESLESISNVFYNASFFESEINDLYGSVFIVKKIENIHGDFFYLDQNAFDSVIFDNFYFRVLTCGEFAKSISPEKGYNERFLENYGDSFCLRKFLVKSSRIDYYSGYFSNLCLCELIEKSLEIEPPKRAIQLRIILSEIIRINYNLNHISSLLRYSGLYALSATVVMMKEQIKDILDSLQGRPVYEFNCIGGVLRDINEDFRTLFDEKTRDMLKVLEDLKKNNFVKTRLQGILSLKSVEVVKSGFTGVFLRSAGVEYDVRNFDQKKSYIRVPNNTSFVNPVDETLRFDFRIEEIIKSYGIIIKAFDRLKAGDISIDSFNDRVPDGEYFHCVESPRGRFGIYLKSNGSHIPSAICIETPSISLYNYLTKIENIHLDEIPLHIHSLGFSMSEVDR